MKKIAFLILCCLHVCANDLTWGSPVTLSTLGVDSLNPRVGMDESGNIVAAWVENGVVMANTQSFGGSWAMSATPVSSMGASSLQLVVDPAGNATAIWNQSGVIQTSTLPLGGMWTTPVDLSSTGSSAPQIDVDSSGNLAAIWVCNDVIQAATQEFGMSWSSSTDLSFASPPSDSPQIAIGGNQTIVAVWHSTSSGVDAIFATSTMLGTSWPGGSSVISDTSTPVSSVRPKVDVNSLGIPMVAWYGFEQSGPVFSNVRVQVALGNLDTTWNLPTDLSAPGIRDPSQLMLSIADNGLNLFFALWTNSYDSSSFSLEGSVFVGDTWLPTIQFDTGDIYLRSQHALVSETDYAYGAFVSYDPMSTLPIIKAFKANTDNTEVNFGNILAVSTGPSNSPRIDGTLLPTGHTAAAVWQNYNGSNLIIQASVATGVALPQPTGLSVTQNVNNFGVFSEYYNTFSWTSSMPDSSSRWVIFRNGVFLLHLPVATTTFIDHNVIQNAAVTYSVALQSQDGDMSPIASASFP